MKCYCYETDAEFIFCVEDVESTQLENYIEYKGWKRTNGKFLMPFPQHMFSNDNDKELIGNNFARLGQAFFESGLLDFDWEKPLEQIAQKFSEMGIEWYVVGSVGDAIRGVRVKPGDIDIVVHTRDYHRAKAICYNHFSDTILWPFTDNKGMLALQYMARMFVCGALFEIAADDQWNMENRKPKYERVSWKGYDFYIDDLQLRYNIEIARERADRITAIEEYMA
jgi:hypothetical protein